MTDKQRRAQLAKVVRRLKATKKGYDLESENWREIMAMLAELDVDLRPEPKPQPQVPMLGPVYPGGPSLLKVSLTHKTSGLDFYPAVDTAWTAGQKVIAPEDGKVTRHSGGESGGYSVYIEGRSGLRYYFTHLNPQRRPLGPVRKGDFVGTVGSPRRFPAQRIAHAHVGVNIEQLVGKGRQLKYGTTGRGPDYTGPPGPPSPPVGEQLAGLL